MTTWDEGDVATVDLDVSPSGPTTAATLVVYAPDGLTRAVEARPLDDARSQWRASVPVDLPGLWDAVWTVRGEGAGSESVSWGVRPTLAGSAYATTADLARYLGDVPPAGARPMLAQASRVVDAMLVGARYAVDDDGRPTSPLVVRALRDATCAQAAAQDDPTAVEDDDDRWSSVKIGSVSLTDTRPQPRAADPEAPVQGAHDALVVAGLLPIRPDVVG